MIKKRELEKAGGKIIITAAIAIFGAGLVNLDTLFTNIKISNGQEICTKQTDKLDKVDNEIKEIRHWIM